MKITGLEPFAIQAAGRSFLFVVVDTDAGISGIGECGVNSRSAAIVGAFDHIREQIVGEDSSRIEHLWQTMFRGGFFPADSIVGSAMSAVDIALWDIRGKELGVPTYQLLGGLVRDKVICYPHNRCDDGQEAYLEHVRQTVAEGWKFTRFHLPSQGQRLEPRDSIRACVKQVEAVRAEFGDDLEICVDVHTRLDPSEAIELANALEPYRIFFLEDPIRSESTNALRRVRAATKVPIAAGEQYAGKWAFRELIEDDLIDYCRVDLCIAGGLTEAKKIAGWCETHYIRLVTHNPLGPVSSAACLALNLSSPNFGVQEQPTRPGAMLNDLFPVQIEWKDGYLLPPTRPGLGIEFDRQALRKCEPSKPLASRKLHREDGSYTNW
ncbi:MAG: mandelate racemase/muconate lactonizing enzyme family protein [Chloroflexi bacterium]|nr:mandelate racemase/muconate lactonizing enzyme family protein [Chloroflexota bacterium]